MPMTADQIIAARRQVGNAPDDATLNATYDRLLDVDAVVLEVLEIRLAELLRKPAQFSVPGEYSQSTDANIKALTERIASLGGGSGLGSGVVTIVSPEPPEGR